LVNDGTATAKDVVVFVKAVVEGNLQVINFGTPHRDWEDNRMPAGTLAEFWSRRPIHPRRSLPIFTAQWDVKAGSSPATDYVVVPQCPAPSFELAVSCENQGLQVIKIEFGTEEMIQNRAGCRREATATSLDHEGR
jgi:hypothetical protein